MPGNSFGQLFRLTTAGESHGPANVVILDGVPPGLPLASDDFIPDMNRRRPGQSRITTSRNESDTVQILSGVFDGFTTGTALALLIQNRDQRSKDYEELKDIYRPGHADYTYDAKFGRRDYRGGGRSSARETVTRVAAAVVAKKILAYLGASISITGYVKQIGNIIADIPAPETVTRDQVEASDVRCPDPEAAVKMIELIEAVRKKRDSIGGIAEIIATGVPPGWGEPVFDKLRADLGKALLSLPAVMGLEFGSGFAVATARGSDNNDIFILKHSKIVTKTNRHGGILGGISTGMPLVMRCAVKPTSSIPQKQPTLKNDKSVTEVIAKGRHDPCLLPRFIPIAEAMVAIVLADHGLRQKAL